MTIERLKKHCEETVSKSNIGSNIREEHQAVLDIIKENEYLKKTIAQYRTNESILNKDIIY